MKKVLDHSPSFSARTTSPIHDCRICRCANVELFQFLSQNKLELHNVQWKIYLWCRNPEVKAVLKRVGDNIKEFEGPSQELDILKIMNTEVARCLGKLSELCLKQDRCGSCVRASCRYKNLSKQLRRTRHC